MTTLTTSSALAAPKRPRSSHDAPDSATVDGLINALEEFSRVQRESSTVTVRDLGCARSSLAILRILDKSENPLQIGDLAQAMRIDVSVASRQVGALVSGGYVERTVAADDRRARTIALTASGRALAAEMFDAWRNRTRQVFGDWSPDELNDAIVQLRKIADTVVRSHDTVDQRAMNGKGTLL